MTMSVAMTVKKKLISWEEDRHVTAMKCQTRNVVWLARAVSKKPESCLHLFQMLVFSEFIDHEWPRAKKEIAGLARTR